MSHRVLVRSRAERDLVEAQQWYESERRAGIARFPYLVFYVVAGDRVSVIACLHGHRDPKVLLSRLR